MAKLSTLIKPLTTNEMFHAMNILNHEKKYYIDVMSYDALLQNNFPQNNFAIVFNTLSSFQRGIGHWCVLFNDRKKKKFTYFNSLNGDIEQDVQYLIESRFKQGDCLISNSVALQSSFSMACGYICLYILEFLMKGLNLNEIIEYELDMYNFIQIENKVIENYFDVLLNK